MYVNVYVHMYICGEIVCVRRGLYVYMCGGKVCVRMYMYACMNDGYICICRGKICIFIYVSVYINILVLSGSNDTVVAATILVVLVAVIEQL